MKSIAGRYDAIVIGGGHNGLITAAYLARAKMATLLIEARTSVGGTASSESFGSATVNVCNCDHLAFRTTPVMAELDLGSHGLVYDDVDPAQHLVAWSALAGDPGHSRNRAWTQYHDVDRTLDSLGQVLPDEVDGYRRYLRDAMPAVSMIFEAANEPPTRRSLVRRAIGARGRALATLLRWSRRSAADVLGSYFSADSVAATGAVGGPMVWGLSPQLAGTGLGALPHAMRHVAQLGRPRGGSGELPRSILRSFEAHGGTTMLSTRVVGIDCTASRVCGVTVATPNGDQQQISAPIVVSAVDPHRTFVRWLRNPPSTALAMIDRWRATPQHQGYESKIDAVVSEAPVLRAIGSPTAATTVIAPSLAEMDRGFRLMQSGRVLEFPAMLVNVPTIADPSMGPTVGPGRHVLSIEVLFTPYGLARGWPSSDEPKRWLDLLASQCEPGLIESMVEFRAMTPDRYEREFFLPQGHATSFAGGPLAVFRRSDPELTAYETSVAGLYITGAATFPGAGVWGASGRNCAGVIIGRHA